MTRCHNANSDDFEAYGGRGIQVCSRWHDVANFIADMGVRPRGASIDRIDNEKGYEPGNCRWSNPTQQANNTRKNVTIEALGGQLTIAEAARKAGVTYKRLHYLVRVKGITPDEAITQLKGSIKA